MCPGRSGSTLTDLRGACRIGMRVPPATRAHPAPLAAELTVTLGCRTGERLGVGDLCPGAQPRSTVGGCESGHHRLGTDNVILIQAIFLVQLILRHVSAL